MPTATLARTLGVSDADLARLYAEIEQHLAQHAPAARPFGLPSTDALIAQAGIRLGPAPRPRRRILARRRTATVAEHLLAVADLIDTYGWAQGALRRGPAMCILGAQQVLVTLGHSNRETADAAGRHLNQQLGGGRPYWEWNDSRYRTKGDVVALIRSAATTA
ncbi:hypothetical protein RM780_03930 [Streptomyces sp. DSM 44917]|uniref:Uncharacterized protein n=1 Tax=Streptomyces boetiae TaxID=3075541 RepID=A0ABU2L421_9ACTN|nr:hypothetical protein [Streptomyces sp. DSM 44917]MDT0306112.1 hypothetical protein [Streptomyces sp. DSM 44917]